MQGIYPATLKVTLSILAGIASALLVELPFAKSLTWLTTNVLSFILITGAAIIIQLHLDTYDRHYSN